jgi:hypothetical protein
MNDEVSQAVVLFLGFGVASSPRHDDGRLVQQFGAARGAVLEAEVRSLLREVDKINVDWSAHSLASAGKMARQHMHVMHPDLSEAALNALEWMFTFDWK